MADTPNTAEPQKPHCRRFQFRLRTMLIGMTVLGSLCGGYMAHEAKIVADRKAWIKANPQAVCWTARDFGEDKRFDDKLDKLSSALRRWFGDQPYFMILDTTTEDRDEAQQLFPEANVAVLANERATDLDRVESANSSASP